MRILFIGDIVGRPGRAAVKKLLPGLVDRYRADVVVANGENAAGGFGLTRKTVDELYELGADVITTGNHIWDKKEVLGFIEDEERLLRPANFPPGLPGKGLCRMPLQDGRALWVINLQGKILMPPIDCPFRKVDELLARIPPTEKCVLVDMHAEATSEKRAMGFYLDGRASVVVGSHTHVPTADGEILPQGTGYLTDAGMTGPYASVIGMTFSDSLDRLLTGMSRPLNVAKQDLRLAGIYADLDDTSGRCLMFESFVEKAG
jgi:metallophosphoesterase (TIGR00282 family)